ncbi:carboxylic ester hydrolase [Aureococcus anophagefferens]|nr:carboxylic ester hydrolase [Aureococcus anophagefferens]
MGVPYAAPPVGSLRWAPPAPFVKQPGVRDCRSFEAQGPRCLQRRSSSFATSEDCLRLSIWTPSAAAAAAARDAAAADLPVMVYLHGGSLVGGGALSLQAADGGVGSLASAGRVVSVSVAYRLGVLGFLASPALESARGTSGNYGLLDVIASLEWVKANARSFGGDPERITVYGQSSGGSLVFALLASPLARGLFRRAISMSGSPRLNSTLEEAYGYWHREPVLATRCAALIDGPELRDCLYSLDASELVAAQPDDWDAATFSYSLRRGLPEADFSPGDDARTWTAADMAAFLANETAHLGPDFVDGLLDAYDVRGRAALDAQRLYSEILADASIVRGYEPLYAFHAVDMFMLFNFTNGYAMTDGDRAYSRSLVSAFAGFARDGALPRGWRRFSGDGSYGVVDWRDRTTATTATNLKKRQCKFWLRHDAYRRYALGELTPWRPPGSRGSAAGGRPSRSSQLKVYARGEDDEDDVTEHPVATSADTVPHRLTMDDRQSHFINKSRSNFVSDAYARARRRGGVYMLSHRNQKRYARGRFFRTVDVLYALFRDADTDHSGTLAVGELMAFLGLEHSDFANRIFCMMEYIRGQHVSGSCDYESYVVSVWNVCTLQADEYRDFCFKLYDVDESGYLDRAEILDLVADITTETFAGSERTSLLLQDLITMIEDSHHDAISKTEFEAFCRDRAARAGVPAPPAHAHGVRGAAFWDMIGERRRGAGGARQSAVDLAGQESSAFVPLRRLIIEYDRAKMNIIDDSTKKRSMSMCTTVVMKEEENPLVSIFKRKRAITLEMMEEMELMTKAIRDNAFVVPADYRDNFDLNSNMRRDLSLENERRFRVKERKKLIKWLTYSDDFEALLDDDEFAELRARSDEKKRMIALENAQKTDQDSNHEHRSEGTGSKGTKGQQRKAAKKRWKTLQVRAHDAHERTADDKGPDAADKLKAISAAARAKRGEDGPETEGDVSDLEEEDEEAHDDDEDDADVEEDPLGAAAALMLQPQGDG